MSVDYRVEGHVAIITLNRPEAMNALDPETSAAITDHFRRIREDDTVRVVIVTGAGERAFCAGADLKKTMPPKESFAQLTYGKELGGPNRPTTDKPIIAAINGVAVGGGLELAMRCDIRICVDSARLGLPETKIGSIPGAGGTQRLPRLVGMSNALMLMLTSELITADEAFRIGLVSKVVPREDLMPTCMALAEKIAGNAPLAVRAVKKLAYDGMEMTLEQGIAAEAMAFGTLRNTKDRIEGRVAFQEKRKPVYRGE